MRFHSKEFLAASPRDRILGASPQDTFTVEIERFSARPDRREAGTKLILERSLVSRYTRLGNVEQVDFDYGKITWIEVVPGGQETGAEWEIDEGKGG